MKLEFSAPPPRHHLLSPKSIILTRTLAIDARRARCCRSSMWWSWLVTGWGAPFASSQGLKEGKEPHRKGWGCPGGDLRAHSLNGASDPCNPPPGVDQGTVRTPSSSFVPPPPPPASILTPPSPGRWEMRHLRVTELFLLEETSKITKPKPRSRHPSPPLQAAPQILGRKRRKG